jgi:cytochrome c-type biogenesis protein CcmF
VNPGQFLTWIAFLASLVAGLGFLAATGGREGALRPARVAFRVQWVAYLAAAGYLWLMLFQHRFQYQYVASYSSRSMPAHFIYAAFWGGQEGTFMLWAFITCTLGLVLMRMRSTLTTPAMLFLNLPLIMLGLVTVMRGPFLMFPAGRAPLDGQGLNPLLQDIWMTIHPPVLFTGFSSLAVPFAIAMAALVRRQYDGWIKAVLPWVVFSTAILATGFIMGGVWAYKVLGWGGYWGWDPVENGSFIPWLANVALLHGLLVQRVTGSLRRTNFLLAVTSYVLVLYASFLTRSGVLADFSVHSFANLGLTGFLLAFLFTIMIVGYGFVFFRWRDMPGPVQPLGNFSRESMMWLGQLVFMLMCALTAVGMSAPLLTRMFGPPSNVQTAYYNLVNAPLAIAMGLLLGIAPLMRWRSHEATALLKAALPAVVIGMLVTLGAIAAGVRDPMPAAVIFAAAFALVSNVIVTVRGYRSGWKHGNAYLGHAGVAILLIGIVASSKYGSAVQVQLPQGEERSALGYRMTYQGVRTESDGKDRVMIAVQAPQGAFEASPALYWSEFNQGYMKKPHIERYLTHDLYISPLEMVGATDAGGAVWFSKGETREIGQAKYTFIDFDRKMGEVVQVAARMRVEIGGRTVPVRPILEMDMKSGTPNRIPDYLPGGGQVTISAVDPNTGRVALELPGMTKRGEGKVLAVEVSTKPLINLVWLGAILMLGSAFLSVVRRAQDVSRMKDDRTVEAASA